MFDGPNHSAPRATRYVALAGELAARISDGRLRGGERLAGEHELARSFGVSRVTVRSALEILSQKGLVVKRAGSGTFIAGPLSQQDPITLESLQEQFSDRELSSNTRLLEYRYLTVSRRDARTMLRSDVVFMSRLFFADGTPFALTRSHLHPDARKISHDEAERTPSHVILARTDHPIARSDMRLKAVRANKQTAELLEISTSQALLVLDRTSFSADGEPIEHTECFLRPEAFEFAFSVRGHVSLASSFARFLVGDHTVRG
jgi:GntR family transcriptional regulator